MAKGKPQLSEASGSSGQTSVPATQQSTPSSVTQDNNKNVSIKFARNDDRNEYDTTINQRAPASGSNQSNTNVESTGEGKDSKYNLVINNS